VVTNEQLYILISVPMLSNAVVTLLGIVFLEMRSNTRDWQRAERPREKAVGAQSQP
jgi:hypothetical protein